MSKSDDRTHGEWELVWNSSWDSSVIGCLFLKAPVKKWRMCVEFSVFSLLIACLCSRNLWDTSSLELEVTWVKNVVLDIGSRTGVISGCWRKFHNQCLKDTYWVITKQGGIIILTLDYRYINHEATAVPVYLQLHGWFVLKFIHYYLYLFDFIL